MEQDSKSSTKVGLPATANGRVVFQRFHFILLSVAVGYLAFVLSLAIPTIQRNLIFLHKVKLPIGADFDTPERYGLSPHKTVNLRIDSTGDVSLGSWFTFSDPYFSSPTFNSSNIPDALKSYPTVLYLHGNAATRALHRRVAVYSTFSSRLRANILAIDYRGFGDSTGTPTEEGTIQDAIAAFDWLVSNGADPKDVLVVGHSLGAAIAAQMTARVEKARGTRIRGLVLMAGFTSINLSMETFMFLGVRILAPIRYIPGAWQLLLKFTQTHYATEDHILHIASPIMLAHARDDAEIPYYHSLILFNELLDSLLPPVPPSLKSVSPTMTEAEFNAVLAHHKKHQRLRDELVHTSRVKEDSIVRREFSRDGDVKVVYLETLWGGHDRMALQEGVQDVIREVFGLGRSLSSR